MQTQISVSCTELHVCNAGTWRSGSRELNGNIWPESTSIAGTLLAGVGGIGIERSGQISDALTGFGDLYPSATLKWNVGVNNYMVYLTGDIPVGAYDSTRLSNIGIGHGAIDGGVGYTYFDPTKGHEFSAVAGLTYNLRIQALITRTASTFIWTGRHRNSCLSNFLSEPSAISTTRLVVTAAPVIASAVSNPV